VAAADYRIAAHSIKQGRLLVRRILLCVVLIVALALPTQAIASTKSYGGGFDPSGSLSFKVKKKKHKKKRVIKFLFQGVPMTCDDGAHTTSGLLTFAMKVKKGSFHGDASFNNQATLVVQGELSGSSASGALQAIGALPIDGGDGAAGTNCDTGVRPWSAARG
jgi:hypothetical protein